MYQGSRGGTRSSVLQTETWTWKQGEKGGLRFLILRAGDGTAWEGNHRPIKMRSA